MKTQNIKTALKLGIASLAMLFAASQAYANATIYLEDSTGYNMQYQGASVGSGQISSSNAINLPMMQGGPMASTISLRGNNAPQGSVAWTPKFDGKNTYQFTVFAGGKPWGTYTNHYCISIVKDGQILGKKCTNPTSDWDPAEIDVPNFVDGSNVKVILSATN